MADSIIRDPIKRRAHTLDVTLLVLQILCAIVTKSVTSFLYGPQSFPDSQKKLCLILFPVNQFQISLPICKRMSQHNFFTLNMNKFVEKKLSI